MTSGPDFIDPMQIASRMITYNAHNMPVQIEHAGTVITDFIYDGDGVRAKKAVQGGGATYYVNDNFEVINGEPVKYVFAGNLRIAKLTAPGRNYFHKDHLGSSTVMTDETGTQVETSEYMPFGHIRDHVGTEISNYKFTDQELDTESGLYNYDARLYDPVIGRFISPDSIVPRPFDPQSLNRYSYCRNNPLIYTDPSGYWDVEEDGEGGYDLTGWDFDEAGVGDDGIESWDNGYYDHKMKEMVVTASRIYDIEPDGKKDGDSVEVLSTVMEIYSGIQYSTTQAGKDMFNLAIHGDPFAKTALGLSFVTTAIPAAVTAVYYSPAASSVALANPQTIDVTCDFTKSMFPGTTPTPNWSGVYGAATGKILGTEKW